MGGGASKANNQNGGNSKGKTPVANVNNGDVTGFPQKNVADKKTDDRGNTSVLIDNTNIDHRKDFGKQSPIKQIVPNTKEREKDKKDREKGVKNGSAFSSRTNNVSALQFENDSDFDDDIDEVLRIPMGKDLQVSKSKKSKKDKVNNSENEDFNRRNYDYGQTRNEDEPLPETYAQRLQRKQYKLQQDMLIREKTIMRNSQEWDRNDDYVTEEDSPRKGFDPSKFRQANKGQEAKKDLFSTVPDDLKTPRYLQSTGQNLDEVDVDRRRGSPNKQLPSYNQSELDLMQQLEQDIF